MKQNQLLFSSFERLQDFPLDPSSIFKSEKDLQDYVENNKIAYAGQILAVIGGKSVGVYFLSENGGQFKINKLADISIDARMTEVEKGFSQLKEKVEKEYATKVELSDAIERLIDSAPETLDTLKEIANWIEEHQSLFEELDKNFVKRDELNQILENTVGVERTYICSFGGEEDTNSVLIKDSVITEIQIIITKEATIKESETLDTLKGNGVTLYYIDEFGKYQPSNAIIDSKKIDFTEPVSDEKNVYIFSLDEEVRGDSIIKLDYVDFKGARGKMIVKARKI